MFETFVEENTTKVQETMKQSLSIYQIKTAESLLEHETYQNYIKQLKSLVMKDDDQTDIAFAESFFESLYMDLITNYAAMVQSITISSGTWSRYVLNNGLLRALQALESYFSVYGHHQLEEGDIMPYAIFSAALLANIGQVFGEHQFQLVDEHGSFQAPWDPIEGPMTHFHLSWFRMRPIEPMTKQAMKYRTIMIACTKILPEIGYKWIAEDQEVLAWWLDALNDIEEGLAEFKIDLLLDNEFVERSRLIDVDVAHLFPKELMEAEKFLEDIKKQMEQDLKAKKQSYYKTKRSIVISEEMLQKYADKNKISVHKLVKILAKSGISSSKSITKFMIKSSGASGMFTGQPTKKSVSGIEIAKQQFKALEQSMKGIKVMMSAAYAAKFIQSDQAAKMAKAGESTALVPGQKG